MVPLLEHSTREYSSDLRGLQATQFVLEDELRDNELMIADLTCHTTFQLDDIGLVNVEQILKHLQNK